MVLSLPLLSCESSVSVKENPDRKKKRSSVCEFKKRYKDKFRMTKRENREVIKTLLKYWSGKKVDRPLLLGEFDAKTQSYITALSNRGSVISRSVATSAAKALIKQHPVAIAYLDLESSSWAQSIFQWIGYACQRHTSAKVNIQDVATKETEYIFMYFCTKLLPKLKSTQYQTRWSSNSTRHYLKLFRMENCSSLFVGANDAKSS